MFSRLLNKKADLSVNVIIIAAIALIVLVVLIIVFTGRFGIFNEGIKSFGNPSEPCTAEGQDMRVVAREKCDEARGERKVYAKTKEDFVCCKLPS